MLTLRAGLLALLIAPSAHAQSYSSDAETAQAYSFLDADTTSAPVVVHVEHETQLPLRELPGRGITNALALVPGVDRHEGTDSVAFGALGGDRVAHYLNGVPVRARLPWSAVSSVEVFTGHVPASLSDALTGAVSVTTRSEPDRFTAGGGLQSSTGAEGNRVASAHVGAPLFANRLHVQAFGEIEGWADHHPRALMGPQLRDGLLEQIMEHPQVISEANEIVPAPYTLTRNDFRSARLRAGSELRQRTFFGNATWHQYEWLSFSVLGRAASSSREDLPFAYSLFQDTPFSRTVEHEWGVQTALALRPTPKATVRVMGDLSSLSSVTHHPSFTSEPSDLLFYGDLDHPANAVAARYLAYDPFGDRFWPAYGDGSLPHPTETMSVFAAPGARTSGYEKSQSANLYLTADASLKLRQHDVTLGLALERQTRRGYGVEHPHFFAGFYDDGNVELGEDAAVSDYEDIPTVALYGVYYYGYDIYGSEDVSSDDVTAYAGFPQTSTDLAPFRPQRYSGYIQDRATFGPVRLEIGVRLDAFDNNTRVLFDPYAFFPLVRAGDLAERPAGIGSEFAVYYDVFDRVVGYRDLEGTFYDPTGVEAPPPDRRTGVSPKATALWTTPEVFRDSPTITVVQPRVRAEVSVLPATTLFVSYGRFARRALHRSHVSLQEYRLATSEGSIMYNASLRPELRTLYSVGLQQEIGEARFGVRLFKNIYDDLVGLSLRPSVFPYGAVVYDNIHEAEANGLELSLSLMRRRGFWGSAGYVVQTADGTAIDSHNSTFHMQVDPSYRPPSAALDLERRHQIKAVVGYGVERGPRLAGVQPLAGVDLSLFADVKSGRPYSTYEQIRPIWTDGTATPLNLNGERMPWTYLLNAKVSKAFEVGGASASAFVWIENVLDRGNVVDVYGATGLPDDDGFLTSSEGRDALAAWGDLADTFAMYYRYRLADPDHFGIPRMIRVGIDVTL